MIALLACLIACSESEEDREEAAMAAAVPDRLDHGHIVLSAADRTALDLHVAPAREAELPDARTRFGTVSGTADTEAWVVAPVDGRLGTATVAFGSTVAPGAALVTVVPNVAGGDVVGATGLGDAMDAARAEAVAADAALARAEKLAPGGFVSTGQLEEDRAAAASAHSRVSGLDRARRAWTTGEAGALVLRAPIGGRVSDIAAASGGAIHAGDVVARVIGPGARTVDLAVPPDDPIGTSYEVVGTDRVDPAWLVGTGSAVGSDGSRHDRLRVDADLLPGSAVVVRVAVGTSRGVVVPVGAVARAATGDLVFVETTPGAFAARPVDVLATFGGESRVSGVTAGEIVVTDGAMALLGEALRGQLQRGD